MHALSDELFAQITQLTDRGNAAFENEEFAKALQHYAEAFTLIPHPIEDWETSTWVLTAMGDCEYLMGEYPSAWKHLSMAVACPGGLGNAFIHLRLGQVQYERGNMDRAADELARAYMGEGPEIFEGEDKKYLDFLRTRMKGI